MGLAINEIYNMGENVSSNFSSTTDNFYGTPCGVPYASESGCVPSGSLLDSRWNSLTSSLAGRPLTQGQLAYYSPASICPYGYETVGSATKSSGGNVSSSGAAFVLPSPLPEAFEFFDLHDPRPNVLLEAMLEGEQAILCCPRYDCKHGQWQIYTKKLHLNSGYVANTDGSCSSRIPSYPLPSEVCVDILDDQDIVSPDPTVTLTVYGSVYTGEEVSISGTVPFSTYTRELVSPTASGTDQENLGYVAVDLVEVLYLVQGGPDSASAGSRATGKEVGLSTLVMLFTWTLAFTSGFMLLII